jgi:hypothetical protein
MNRDKTIFVTSASLTAYDICNYLDHYIFSDPISGTNIFYPLSAFGGTFSGSTFNSVVSGGPMYDVCTQDFCYKIVDVPSVNLFCTTTVYFNLTGLDESDSNIIKIIYDFDDKGGIIEQNYTFNSAQAINPKDIIKSKTYYPTARLATTYTPSISVIRSNCCINTYRFTLCAFRCSVLDMYENVALLNAQQSTPFNVILTLENERDLQLFSSILNISDPGFAPALSSLPYTVETVPPAQNTVVVDTRVPAPPLDINSISAPAPGYIYRQGLGIDITPDTVTLIPPDYFESYGVTRGITISGDGPPYLQSTGIIIRYS